MRVPSNQLICRTLFLQAADSGRGPVLFGDSLERACRAILPFVEGVDFPSLYLEFPLAGDPFLDVTALYGKLEPGVRFDSPAAAGTEGLLDWYADASASCDDISFGFELDTKSASPGPAAVHFQPRSRIELAAPFCNAAGREDAGLLYTDLVSRMPEGWPPAFFGLFRGRAGSPLRVCGYLGMAEKHRCSEDPSRLEEVFRGVGFTAYDDLMLTRLSAALAAAPSTVDFQFDILPDGTPGSTFAIDIGFRTEESEKIRASFLAGPFADVMNLFESWGSADSRWKLVSDMCFTRSLPVEDENGNARHLALVLQPHWIKLRWTDAVLLNSKMYCLANSALTD